MVETSQGLRLRLYKKNNGKALLLKTFTVSFSGLKRDKYLCHDKVSERVYLHLLLKMLNCKSLITNSLIFIPEITLRV